MSLRKNTEMTRPEPMLQVRLYIPDLPGDSRKGEGETRNSKIGEGITGLIASYPLRGRKKGFQV